MIKLQMCRPQALTDYKRPSPTAEAYSGLADDLNAFYCRFQRVTFTPLHHPRPTAVPTAHQATPFPPEPRSTLIICERDVCHFFERQSVWKYGVTPYCLRACAVQLAPIVKHIFIRSLELCEVPSDFKNHHLSPQETPHH